MEYRRERVLYEARVYCIRRDFAQELLAKQFPMTVPVDNFIGECR